MHVNVAKELAALETMTVSELRAKYAQVFAEETRVGNKAWLVRFSNGTATSPAR